MDASELERLSEGHPMAWERLIRLYRRRMVGLVLAITGDPDDAEDAVQAVFVRVWRIRGRLRDLGSVEGYLLTGARNEARNVCARRQRHPAAQSDDLEEHLEVTSPSVWRAMASSRSACEEVFDELQRRATERQLAVLRALEADPERTSRELAEVLGCSHNNVSAVIRRIRKTTAEIFVEAGLRVPGSTDFVFCPNRETVGSWFRDGRGEPPSTSASGASVTLSASAPSNQIRRSDQPAASR